MQAATVRFYADSMSLPTTVSSMAIPQTSCPDEYSDHWEEAYTMNIRPSKEISP